MIGILLDIFNKKKFDTTEKNINIWDYHSIIKFGLITNGLFLNNPNSKIRFVLPFINLFSCALGLIMMSLNAYHSYKIKNVPEMSESLAYWVVVEVMFIQQFVFLLKAHKTRKLYDVIEIDFAEIKIAPNKIRWIVINIMLFRLVFNFIFHISEKRFSIINWLYGNWL